MGKVRENTIKSMENTGEKDEVADALCPPPEDILPPIPRNPSEGNPPPRK